MTILPSLPCCTKTQREKPARLGRQNVHKQKGPSSGPCFRRTVDFFAIAGLDRLKEQFCIFSTVWID
jgi:hypothetical protein